MSSFSKSLLAPQVQSSLPELFKAHWKGHLEAARQCHDHLLPAFEQWTALMLECVQKGGKVLFFGNGGSASDAQHLATEMVARYKKDRPPLAALALNTDTSALTAIANDYDYTEVFARQVQALGRPEDMAVGISTSGRSPNVLKALKTAKALGLTTVALVGAHTQTMASDADLCVAVPCGVTAHIQEMHITLGHMVIHAVEVTLGLVSPEEGTD
jgi:D-sedoheptulose 7-phosphate isomerase